MYIEGDMGNLEKRMHSHIQSLSDYEQYSIEAFSYADAPENLKQRWEKELDKKRTILNLLENEELTDYYT